MCFCVCGSVRDTTGAALFLDSGVVSTLWMNADGGIM